MLRPEYFDDAASDVLNAYSKLYETGIRGICRRIARMGEITEFTKWQSARLQESGMLYDDIVKAVAAAAGSSEQAILKLFEDAAITAIEYDDAVYKTAGLATPPLQQSPAMLQLLQAGLEKTGGIMRNLTLTTALTSQQAYIQACDLAYMQIASGLMGYGTAIAQAVIKAADEGLTVLYPSGHMDQLDVAIRRAVLTGVNQTCAQAQIFRMDQMGCDLVETTAHPGARPSHAEWQGKVFSRSGKRGYPDFVSSTGYGTGPGLCGWNCRHSFFPYFDGMSIHTYSDETLTAYNASAGRFNGKSYTAYEASQVQRRWEREIRKTKRTLTGLDAALKELPNSPDLKTAFAQQSAKLKQQQARMREFIHATNQLEDKTRTQVHAAVGGHFGRSTAQKAVWAGKKVTAYAQLIGTHTFTGETVTAVADHLGARALARGISELDIKDALTNPLKLGKIRADASRQLTGEHATVVINAETGKLITVWATSSKTAEKLKKKAVL